MVVITLVENSRCSYHMQLEMRCGLRSIKPKTDKCLGRDGKSEGLKQRQKKGQKIKQAKGTRTFALEEKVCVCVRG